MVSLRVFGNEFSIDQEFQVRKLATAYSKKYGMKIKIKRSEGNLVVRMWDQGAFTGDSRITKAGASFVRKISGQLCYDDSQCRVELSSHHSENSSEKGYVSRSLILKKAQYKMTSTALQILKTKITPESLFQKALGDSQPLADTEKNKSISEDEIENMNTRIELKFLPKKGRI